MISHLLDVRHLARLECPFSFPNVACAHAGACLQGRCMTFLNGRSGRKGQDAALVKRPSWSRDRHGPVTYNRMTAREVPGEL